MPDTKITALTAIGANPIIPSTFPIPMVDLTDTSMAASGTTKKVTVNQILGAGGTATLASATITGDLTVRTNGLVVNATGTGVQVSPSAPLCVKTRNSDSVGLRVLQSTGGTSGIQFTDDPVTADWGSILATSANLFVRSNSLLQLQTGGATERLAISSTGVCTWSNVGGVAGTAMTLNSTGLGVGTSPSYKLDVLGVSAATVASGAAFRAIRSSSGDRCLIVPLAAGSGFTIQSQNAAESDFAPIIFSGSTTTFNYRTGVGTLAAGMTLDASGNLLVGTTSALFNSRLRVKTSSTSASDYGVYVADSADALIFALRNDGLIYTGTKTASPYNNTTGSAANAFIAADGTLGRSTSSLKYKTDITDSTRGLADVLKLRPVTYKSKNGDDTIFGGLIAEEVHAAGLTEFVAYAPDNAPDAIHYSNMVSLLVAAIKELTARVQTLETR